jgi:hypothetical protein
MPLYPQNVAIKEPAPTPYPSNVFMFKLTIESTKEFGGASQHIIDLLSPLTLAICLVKIAFWK